MSAQHNNVSFLDWGRTSYDEAMAKQEEKLHQRIRNECPDTVIFTEHDPVYTLGVRPGAEKHLLSDAENSGSNIIPLVKTNRGGDITYHGPGQIMAYAVFHLREKDLHLFLRNLEEVLIRTVGYLGLAAARRPGKTGIWMGDRKLAAIGIGVRKWVTFHGFALNLNPDLSPFCGIVPCGITDGTVTSIEKELGFAPPRTEVMTLLEHVFTEVFFPKNP